MSFGRRLRAARQRAARNKSAVESGPPETASITLASRSISANSLAASRAEIGAASAAGTLLFPLDALFEDHRGAGIFASDLIECRACRVFFAHRRERLPEPEQRVRRFARRLVLDRKSTRLNSSHVRISYAVFCLKKKKIRLLRTRQQNNHKTRTN